MVPLGNKELFMRTKLNIKRSSVFTLLTGAIFGFSFAYFLFYFSGSQGKWRLPVQDVKSYLRHIPLSQDEGPTDPVPNHTHGDHENVIAEELSKKVRLLCWIMTQPSSHEKKARHVRNTWGRRCNHLIFMSTEADYSLPAIRLKVSEGRNSLWAKTKESFKYVYQHYMDRVDWVLKADDDTYVIVENLKSLLSQYNSSERLYFGCRFKPYIKMGYMSGGAGYVLSKAAVKAFVEEALPKKSCRQSLGRYRENSVVRGGYRPVGHMLIYFCGAKADVFVTRRRRDRKGSGIASLFPHQPGYDHRLDGDWVATESGGYGRDILTKITEGNKRAAENEKERNTTSGQLDGEEREIQFLLGQCKNNDGQGAEDVEMGKCLEKVNVTIVDSRDAFGRHRFLPLPPVYFLVPQALPKSNWFWQYIYYPMKEGFDCCSDSSISFHYITPNEMYVLEYFIYHVRPLGVNYKEGSSIQSEKSNLRERSEGFGVSATAKGTSHTSGDSNTLSNIAR